MMTSPLFSIVVPIFNSESFLKRCLFSIVNQTFRDIEIILVNDGSTDKSLDICHDFAKKDTRTVVINKNNKGLSEARNDGLKTAKGQYIIFVDSDDFIEQKTCEIMYNSIKDVKENSFDLIATPYKRLIDNLTVLNPIYIYNHPVSGEEYLKKQLINKSYYNGVRNVYNRVFLLTNNLFFKEGFLAEDFDWVPRVFLKAKNIITINFAFYNNICRKDSITQNNDKTQFVEDALSICKELEILFSKVADSELKGLLMNSLVNSFLNTFMFKKHYHKKKFNNLFDKNFLKNKAYTKYNKLRTHLFCLNKNLYYCTNKVYKSWKYIYSIFY